MITDLDLLFSNAQAVVADAGSTNVIDLAPLGVPFAGGTNLGRNIGVGEALYIFVTIDVASAGGSTSVNLQTDADVAFGSAVTLVTGLIVIPITTPAGTKYFARLPIADAAAPYERYIRLFYDVTGATVTVTAGIVKDPDTFVSYASGYSTGI